MIVQVGESNLVFTSGCLHLIQIEVNRVEIRQRHQHGLQALVLYNGRKVLVGADELLRKTHAEVGARNLVELI